MLPTCASTTRAWADSAFPSGSPRSWNRERKLGMLHTRLPARASAAQPYILRYKK